jgi:hypothetical protein
MQSTVRAVLVLQAMHIGDEAGEALVEGPGERQVIEDRAGRLGEPLARHDQRDTRRVRHQHHRRNPPQQLFDRHRSTSSFTIRS